MPSAKGLVHGVAINDSDYPVFHHSYRDGVRYISWACPVYRMWKNMLRRCYCPKFLSKNPTYAGCSVCDDWLVFSRFRAWVITQEFDGKDLDKDLLFPGNKSYSPDRCVFISHALNSFITDRLRSRTRRKVGVTFHEQTGKYRAKCKSPITGKSDHLGLFITQDSAHKAWLSRKNYWAQYFADLESDQRIAIALRSRYMEVN